MKIIKLILLFTLMNIVTFAQVKNNPEINNTTKTSTNWKTYVNSRYGFKFKYPAIWIHDSELSKSINLKNEITSVSINFSDANNSIKFTVEYFLSPKGKALYEYSHSQFKSSKGESMKMSKEIEGRKVIESSFINSVDRKGNILVNQTKTIIVEFLDKQNTGEFKILFQFPKDKTELQNSFDQILSSFQFTAIK